MTPEACTKTEPAGVLCLDADAIVILEAFAKKSRETPQEVIETCKLRLKRYQDL
jgi:phage-related protein